MVSDGAVGRVACFTPGVPGRRPTIWLTDRPTDSYNTGNPAAPHGDRSWPSRPPRRRYGKWPASAVACSCERWCGAGLELVCRPGAHGRLVLAQPLLFSAAPDWLRWTILGGCMAVGTAAAAAVAVLRRPTPCACARPRRKHPPGSGPDPTPALPHSAPMLLPPHARRSCCFVFPAGGVRRLSFAAHVILPPQGLRRSSGRATRRSVDKTDRVHDSRSLESSGVFSATIASGSTPFAFA